MNRKIFYTILVCLTATINALAAPLDTNTAKLQAMDKITGRVSVIEVPVSGEKKFGSLSVVVRSCKTKPVEETPDNFAFIDITDTDLDGNEHNVFKGWMISSSPATHALEHPIYDVWLLQCIDTNVDKKQLLSQEQLELRDKIAATNNIPSQESNLSANDTENIPSIGASIQEMQSVKSEEPTAEDLLIPDEFSFDEDEEVSDEISDDFEEFVDEKNDGL